MRSLKVYQDAASSKGGAEGEDVGAGDEVGVNWDPSTWYGLSARASMKHRRENYRHKRGHGHA